MAKNIKETEKKISKLQKAIRKINEKEEKDGGLSNVDAGTRSTYQKMLKELEAEKENILNGGSKTTTPKNTPTTTTATAPKTVTPAAPVNKPAAPVNKPSSPKEKRLENVEEEAVATADEMNSEEEKNKKTEIGRAHV